MAVCSGHCAVFAPKMPLDPIVLALARLEPPLSWLDWFHFRMDRVWICQYRHHRQIDYYPILPNRASELRHLGLIEPVDLGWNRDRYVLTPAGLWTLFRKGRNERKRVRLDRAARFTKRGITDTLPPIRSYVPPSVWRQRQGLDTTQRACPGPIAQPAPCRDHA
jgi:hypothetical protein